MNLQEKLAQAAPAYCLVSDDGANYHCSDCDGSFNAKDMLYLATPDGKRHLTCTGCIDSWWLEQATKVEGKI